MRPREFREKKAELERQLELAERRLREAQAEVDERKADIAALERVQGILNGVALAHKGEADGKIETTTPASGTTGNSPDLIDTTALSFVDSFTVHHLKDALVKNGDTRPHATNYLSTRLIRLKDAGALTLIEKGLGRRPSVYKKS